ncbi:MAG: YbaK/EbsC family protein [Eubacteriales bacterium]|nr:YbaK/EbsC family protein [Eubacteriales bacterium]
MIHVSQPMTTVPEHFSTPLQELVYRTLTRLSIPFQRVENDPAVTMEDCQAIDDRLQMQTVKTLFLCNRQQTAFYLFVTPGDKPFRTKDFSAALGVSRVSFATPEQLEQMMGTIVGSATVFGLLLPSAREVRLVFDRALESSEWYGCTDGTTTGYMKLRTRDVIDRLLPYTAHTLEWVEV